jgi:hypothetical protein
MTGKRFRKCVIGLLAAAAMLGASAHGPSRAEDAIPTTDQAAIRSVIEAQITAFQRDDDVAAFSFASPAIQGIFGTPTQFMAMVRSGYQPVYRPHDIRFREPRTTPGGWSQPVLVVGPDGRSYLALYEMQLQPDGVWKINGCQLVLLAEESV